MKTGLTTYSLQNKNFREQLYSMLQNNIKPDFIIVHYGGVYKLIKATRFLKKTLREYRIKSISHFLSRSKSEIIYDSEYKLNAEAEKEVDSFLSKSKIINAKGINSANTMRIIKAMGEAIIVCNSGKLNREVLNIPGANFLNIHASKLPEYRGMNNVEWALWNKHDLYCSIHRISAGIDEGDILLQEKIDVAASNLKSITAYRDYCFYKSNELVGKAIKGYMEKKLFFIRQEYQSTPLAQYYVMHPILKGYLNKELADN